MKIGMCCVLPAMLMLAGCATTSSSGYSASNAAAPAVAPPQRVEVVSDMVGAKIDTILVSRSVSGSDVTR
jgi:uncharacterized lipoprotein YajG